MDSQRRRIAERSTVNRAIDIFTDALKESRKRGKNDDQLPKKTKIESHCMTDINKRNRKVHHQIYSSFFHTHSPKVMRDALQLRDWNSLQKLFPHLLKCIYSESMAWRYIFTIYLCSPYSDQSNLNKFVQMCIYNHLNEISLLLESLFSIK